MIYVMYQKDGKSWLEYQFENDNKFIIDDGTDTFNVSMGEIFELVKWLRYLEDKSDINYFDA